MLQNVVGACREFLPLTHSSLAPDLEGLRGQDFNMT
jgi:hypothetical protein